MSKSITMFTVPRYFRDNFELIQRNAIRSWTRLKPKPDIILLGNEDGVAEFAASINVTHISDVALSDKGTPLINDVFRKAQAIARDNIVGYFSADMIFMNDLLDAIDMVSNKFANSNFMICGQRWDCDVPALIDFSSSDWETNLRILVKAYGKLHAPAGMDYHIFEKGHGLDMPPFVVGRPAWDNWFLAKALGEKLNVVDVTEKITAIHQTHDYSHIKGGFDEGRAGLEAQRNRGLAGACCKFTSHSNWVFRNNEIVKR